MSGHGQLGRTRSVVLEGLTGRIVDVEAHVASGLPAFVIGGLPDAAIAQAPERIKSAAATISVGLAQLRITINLSPAAIPKHGTGFDLPIATAVLAARGLLPEHLVAPVCHLGELGLDGRIKPVQGILPAVLAAARHGIRAVVVPPANVPEARLVDGVTVHAASDLAGLVTAYRELARGQDWPEPQLPDAPAPEPEVVKDLADVVGQFTARTALELAAAGGHHLLLNGPPGAGKTMLAERLVTLLPPLSREEALEVMAVQSLCGTPGEVRELPRTPPFVAPHHTVSQAALVGGGGRQVRPGAVSQAHRGVLFLDEAAEFRPSVLQALRQPIESGTVRIARSLTSVEYPCRFQLVLATNPCPCGRGYGQSSVDCTCSSLALRRYAAKLSGPLIDRVDLQIEVPSVGRDALSGIGGESSATVAARVLTARAAQAKRWGPHGYRLNSEVPGPLIRRPPWRLGHRATRALDAVLDAGTLTLRGYDRVLRVAWTMADLQGKSTPVAEQVERALIMRSGVAA